MGLVKSFLHICAFCIVLSSCASVQRLPLNPPRGEGAESFRQQLSRSCERGQDLACFWLGDRSRPRPVGKLAIMQGISTISSVRLNILLPDSDKVTYVFYPRHLQGQKDLYSRLKFAEAEIKPLAGSSYRMDHLTLRGLEAGISYQLDVVAADGRWLDSRVFETLSPSSPDLKVAVASCMDDSYVEDQKLIWGQLTKLNPDLILFIGDNVYADKEVGPYQGPATPMEIQRRYIETRLALEVFRVDQLTPIFASWDDHDIGQNNGGKSTPHLESARGMFQTFFPQGPSEGEFWTGPGVSTWFQVGAYNFALLDNRSARDETAHLGSDQLSWLAERMQKFPQATFILSGDQFFGGYHSFESYQGNHPAEFKEFLRVLKDSRVPSLLVSGDRHASEVMEIPQSFFGRRVVEITSSPIHAKMFPENFDQQKNPYRVVSEAKEFNFVLIESRLRGRQWYLRIKSIGKEGQTFFDQRIQLRGDRL